MPSGNYLVHFGVKPENVDLVVPGVAGMDTHLEDGTWDVWDEDEGDMHQVGALQHITVSTDQPLPMVTRVLQLYGSILEPRPYDDSDFRGSALIIVSAAVDVYAQSHRGCYTMYAGQESIPDFILEQMHNG